MSSEILLFVVVVVVALIIVAGFALMTRRATRGSNLAQVTTMGGPGQVETGERESELVS